VEIVRNRGGHVLGVAMMVDRSDGAVELGVPMFSLIRLKVETFPADHLPPDLAAIPTSKPGSK
jgi:orotate phosphoribosyltransferase